MTTHRTVLITGGSRGIGLGLARRFHARGDAVLVTGRTAAALGDVERALPGVQTFAGDMGSPDDRERLARRVAAELPDLDLLIDNAGIQRRVPLAADDAPWGERQRELDVLLAGPVHLDHLLIPVLLAHGRPATVVTVTSGGALVPQPFAPLYSAAKAALHSYVTTLRHALAGTSVAVCELMPPAVATGLSGLDEPHGVPVDDLCDAAVAGILAGRRVIGFGPTDTGPVRARLDVEQAMFETASRRFPVRTYSSETVIARAGQS